MLSPPQGEPRPLQFSVRSIVILTVFVAVLLAWVLDHRNLTSAERDLASKLHKVRGDLERFRYELDAPSNAELQEFQLRERSRQEAMQTYMHAITRRQEESEVEITLLRGELVAANQRYEDLVVKHHFLTHARAEAGEAFQDLTALQKYLEWSTDQEEQFLRLATGDQQKLIERARILLADGFLDEGVARGWRQESLLARGVEKRIARQAR